MLFESDSVYSPVTVMRWSLYCAGQELAVFAVVVKQMVQDVQQRLVFRAQVEPQGYWTVM